MKITSVVYCRENKGHKVQKEQLHGWGRVCESKQIYQERLTFAQYFYSKCITRQNLTLKLKAGSEYKTYNGAIRWRMANFFNWWISNLCNSHIRLFFAIVLTVFWYIINISNFDHENIVNDHEVQHLHWDTW